MMTNETLRRDVMKATGCDEDHAEHVLAMAGVGAGLTLEQLPKQVEVLVSDDFPAHMVVITLAGLKQLGLSEPGRELLFHVGMLQAERTGLSSKLANAITKAIPQFVARGRARTARGN
jgi:hypothetical protein